MGYPIPLIPFGALDFSVPTLKEDPRTPSCCFSSPSNSLVMSDPADSLCCQLNGHVSCRWFAKWMVSEVTDDVTAALRALGCSPSACRHDCKPGRLRVAPSPVQGAFKPEIPVSPWENGARKFSYPTPSYYQAPNGAPLDFHRKKKLRFFRPHYSSTPPRCSYPLSPHHKALGKIVLTRGFSVLCPPWNGEEEESSGKMSIFPVSFLL